MSSWRTYTMKTYLQVLNKFYKVTFYADNLYIGRQNLLPFALNISGEITCLSSIITCAAMNYYITSKLAPCV